MWSVKCGVWSVECGVWSVGCGVIPSDIILDKINDILFGNILTVHADALAEIHEVGRGVEADAQAGIFQNSRQRVRNRAFPVGSGHVNRLVATVRMTVVRVERLGGLQAGLVAAASLSFKHRKLAKQKIASLLIIHVTLLTSHFTKNTKITKNNS